MHPSTIADQVTRLANRLVVAGHDPRQIASEFLVTALALHGAADFDQGRAAAKLLDMWFEREAAARGK